MLSIHAIKGRPKGEIMREVTRVLATVIGALLISAGNLALAQEHGGGQQQGEAVPAEMRLPARRAGGLLARLTQRQWPPEQQVEADEPRQPEAMKSEPEQEMPTTEMVMPRDPEWSALTETGLGTTMDLPRAVFSMADGDAHKGVGRRYKTPDGRARVAVWTERNFSRDTPASYLRRAFVIPRATLDYERLTPKFAVVSGDYGDQVYYLRCNLSPRGTFHCFDLAYPVREKKAWDGVVTRMSRSLRPRGDRLLGRVATDCTRASLQF
jgi:hypothetical protein